MKKISFIILVIFLSVISFHYCKVAYGRPVLVQHQEVHKLKVHRIVPVKSIYLIYAKNNFGRIFKIVTEKEEVDSCNDIRIGCSYVFDLCPVIPDGEVTIKEGPLAGLILRRDPHVTGFGMYGGVAVDLEGDSITNIFTVKNVKGLCYLGDSLTTKLP